MRRGVKIDLLNFSKENPPLIKLKRPELIEIFDQDKDDFVRSQTPKVFNKIRNKHFVTTVKDKPIDKE